jgi:hypothetical protein
MLSAPHPNRSRAIYVDSNGVYLNRDGSMAAPFATLQEAFAQCLPDTAYSSFADFQKIGPTIVLAPGEYSGAGLDRSVILSGSAPVTITGLEGACEVLIVKDCGLPELDVTVSTIALLLGCSEVDGTIVGTVAARNTEFGECAITGDLSVSYCRCETALTVSGEVDVFSSQLASLTAHTGNVLLSYVPLLAADAEEGATLTALQSVVILTSGNVSLGGCFPSSTYVPDLVEKTATEAEQLLTVAKLNIGTVTEAYDAEVAEGDIISQAPAAGDYVREATNVDYVLSLGVDPEA